MSSKVFMGEKHVAATEHPLASLAALRMFRRGGNAFDAAVSAGFVMSVVRPHLSGLGGDFFGLFYEGSTGRTHCLNSSGWSPSSFNLDSVTARNGGNLPVTGHGSIVVPGFVAGVYEMHKKFGNLEFSDCLRDAIAVADTGFPIGPRFVRALGVFKDSFSDAAKRVFMPRSDIPAVGDIIVQKELAKSIVEISKGGTDGFYRGESAEAIREEMASAGYELSSEDFSSFSPEWCDPLKMTYRDTEVFEVPPNSMGATSLLILKLLERTDMSAMRASSGERVKTMVEAAQVAYEARDRELGDPRFGRFELAKFLSSEAPMRGGSRVSEGDTTYFAVADDKGNLLSCIQSVAGNFGSTVFVEKAGFFLNNRGSGFSRSGPNKLEPRKRPLHTLSAMILAKGGAPIVAIGASGGAFRPQQHALFATNMIDYKMSVDAAIDYPRFLWDSVRGVRIEKGMDVPENMVTKSMPIEYPGETGVGQGVEVLGRTLKGACDVRGEGMPFGD